MDNFLDLGLGNYAILEYITNKNSIGPISEGLWRLYFDGACPKTRVDIGLIIESTKSRMKPHSYKLEFECTSNEVEYEVLIQGLELARNMPYQKFVCFWIF